MTDLLFTLEIKNDHYIINKGGVEYVRLSRKCNDLNDIIKYVVDFNIQTTFNNYKKLNQKIENLENNIKDIKEVLQKYYYLF